MVLSHLVIGKLAYIYTHLIELPALSNKGPEINDLKVFTFLIAHHLCQVEFPMS